MIQMPWTKETFSFFLCKIWNKRQLKNTSLKQFLCPSDNENWRETCQFGYVGGPLSMLTLTWPYKNHWKLFDGSRDFKNMCWKTIVTCTGGFQKCHLLKMRFQEQKDLPKNVCSTRILVSLRVYTPGQTLLWSGHVPWSLGPLFQGPPQASFAISCM